MAAPSQGPVAVCVSGQLRTMVRRSLHLALRAQLLQPLGADLFVHVDAADTRQWGPTRDAATTDFRELVHVLRPVAAHLVSYSAPPVDASGCGTSAAAPLVVAGASRRAEDAATAAAPPMRVCAARDCGTFSCGCYLRECTHCVVSQYVPQHLHTTRCLEMIAAAEASRGRRYDVVIKTRPDLNVTRPIGPYSELLEALRVPPDHAARGAAAARAPPTLCMQGGGAPIGQPAPFATQPLTMDDKFALMPRRVATVYMNATAAFQVCQERRTNVALCGGDAGGRGRYLIKSAGSKAKVRMHRGGPADGNHGTAIGRSLAPLSKPWSKSSLVVKRHHASSGGSRPPPPYWATPQCVLRRHLLSALPELHTVDCLRRPGEPVPLRLVRPTSR